MKLITHIEYHTVWGQDLYLRSGIREYPMKYAPGDIWTAEVDGLEEGQTFGYRYEVHEGGFCVRTEWLSHSVTVPECHADGPVAAGQDAAEVRDAVVERGVIEVRDAWSDVPEDLPLRSAPFAEGIFRKDGRSPWRAAGTAVPVFSLRSESGFGTGEFNDLKLLADWAAMTGQKVIQLLPVNDTTRTWSRADSYPYNAVSSFALHPQFIHLPAVGVEEDEEYLRLRRELNALPELDYERVNREKHRLLRKAFAETGAKIMASEEFKTFCRDNAGWLFPYAAFCVLRDESGTSDFSSWKGCEDGTHCNEDFSVYDADKVSGYARAHKKGIDYWCFVQYHLHVQLLEARDYARSKGVIFKGDLPIGVSRTSADAWVNASLFNMDSCAGAPPDAFSADGQNWGFPTYDWDAMAKDGYAWWKARLGRMSQYFDAFRIDHILGFFRIWEIPVDAGSGLLGHFNPSLPYSAAELAAKGFDLRKCAGRRRGRNVLFVPDPRRKGYWHPCISAKSARVYAALDAGGKSAFDSLYEDFFYHRHTGFWKESAMRKLPALLSATGMLACGEDLGMIPACVPETMAEYRILSLEIQRMPKKFGERFADPATYPYYSVCTTSTHDTSTLRAWWEEDREQTEAYWHEMLGEKGNAPETCSPDICRRIIGEHLGSPSMLAILPLQDWLSIDGTLRSADPEKERVNVPSDPHHYWRYRMHLTLEALLQQDRFNARIREMVSASGR